MVSQRIRAAFAHHRVAILIAVGALALVGACTSDATPVGTPTETPATSVPSAPDTAVEPTTVPSRNAGGDASGAGSSGAGLPQPTAPPAATIPPSDNTAEIAPVDACPAYGSGTFVACYFQDQSFTTLAYSQEEAGIDFDWLAAAPNNQLPPDRFAARWQGEFEFTGGTHEFVATADDYVRVTVDGQVVISGWWEQPTRTFRATVDLSAGTHRVRVDYADGSGLAEISVKWAEQAKPYFTYAWEASETLVGRITVPKSPPRPVVLLNGEPTLTLSSTAALRLANDFAIVLVNDEEAWDSGTAGLLYELVKRLPDTRMRVFDAHPWRVTLTDETLVGDVEVTPWT